MPKAKAPALTIRSKVEKPAENEDARDYLRKLERLRALKLARDDILAFAQLMMPDLDDPDDVNRSQYKVAAHHQVMADGIHRQIKGHLPRWIVTMPPRHGKTQLVTKFYTAWRIGKFPDESNVVATYNSELAGDFGREVRAMVQSPTFQAIFPECQLRKGSAAADRLVTEQNGTTVFVGRGQALSGRGAHCFPAGTMIATDQGEIPIEDVSTSCKVLTYSRHKWNHYGRVTGIGNRKTTGLYRLTLATGRVIETTPEHPFFTKYGWMEARQLAAGDMLMQAVWQDVPERFCGYSQENGESEVGRRWSQVDGLLLLRKMLGYGRELEKRLRAASLQALWQAESAWSGSQSLLQCGVSGGWQAEERREFKAEAKNLSNMQQGFSAKSRSKDLLRDGLQERGARQRNDEGWECALEERGFRPTQAVSRRIYISEVKAACYGAGRLLLRYMRGVAEAFGVSSRRQRADQQRLNQFSNALQQASSGRTSSDRLWQSDTDRVERIDYFANKTATVYNFSVEETENYYANGVLVHNCLICDDLVKDASEADSPTVREKMWQWFTQVAMTRLMSSVGTSVMLTFTRWHEDDVIGRLTNPDNPCYDPDIAAQWEVTNCPFFAEEKDALGRKPGDILWPERFDREFGETQQRLNPRAFQALYQQNPSAQEGNYFKKSWLHTYEGEPRKEELNIFAASDHAVATGETNDKTAMIVAGVDKHGQIYVLDCVWGRFDAAQQVEKMIELMRKWEPRIWWAEKQHMGQALGPFLRKRKLEEGVNCVIEEVHANKDKESRARSLQGMMADNRVLLPYRCWWRMAAEDEILKFPRGTYDDFVDALSWLGMKIQQLYAVREPKKVDAPAPRTLEWIKKEAAHQRRMGDMRRIRGGW